jgi:hypothetical protein
MPLDSIKQYRTQIGKHVTDTENQGAKRTSRAQAKLLHHIDQYSSSLNRGFSTPQVPLNMLSLAAISCIVLAGSAHAQVIANPQQTSQRNRRNHFSLTTRDGEGVSRQRRQASHREILPTLASSTYTPNQIFKTHACFGHKIIFHHALLQKALDTIQPEINTMAFHTLFDRNGQINLDHFIVWYQQKSSFDKTTVKQSRALLEIMLMTINSEQAQQKNPRLIFIAHAFAMAEAVIANQIQNGLTTVPAANLVSEPVQTLQQQIDQDIVVRWHDTQRWSDVVKILNMSKQGSNIDCRILETFQQKYRHLAEKKTATSNTALSAEDRQILKKFSIFWQKRFEFIWENARDLIHQFIQPLGQGISANETENQFLFLPQLSLIALQNQDDFRHQPTKGPFFQVNFHLRQGNFAAGLVLFAHTIHQIFGASFLIKGLGQSAIVLSPTDFDKRSYSVLVGGKEVSYQHAFDQLLELSFHLNELTLAQFLYKALAHRILDSDILHSLQERGINKYQAEINIWAWVLHIAVCQEQTLPGIGIRALRILEMALQQEKDGIRIVDLEDDQGNMRHVNLVQLFNPQGPFFPALFGQHQQRDLLISHLPQLKDEYDAFVTHSAHCTCEITAPPDRRSIRSPQKKKAIECSTFTQHLAAQLKNDPRYLAERDLIPRQEFESIKRYGVDHIEQIRQISDTDSNTAERIKQTAMQTTQEQFDRVMIDAYAPYKKLRKKETTGQGLNTAEKNQMLGFAQEIATDQQKKINKGIELLNRDIQIAFDNAKKTRPALQRTDFPELKKVQVNALHDTRPSAHTPLLEIKIPTGGNFAETLSAVGKSILYVEGDLQLTYRIAIQGVGTFDFRVMGRKSLQGTNDQKWRLQTKNSKQIQTKLGSVDVLK